MKKRLLACSFLLAAGLSQTANAQLALETFSSSLPANWVLISDGKTVPSTAFNGAAPTLVAGLNANAWFPFAFTTGNYAMASSSVFSPTGQADRWLITPSFNVTGANTLLKWDDNDLGSNEKLEILVSPTAGTTAASFTTSLYNAVAGNAGASVTHGLSLAAFSGQTIRIAFREHNTNIWGLYIDNVSSAIFPSADGSLDAVSFPKVAGSISSNPVNITVSNQGIATITSLKISYTLDAAAPVVQTFTGLSIASFGSQALSFSTPIANPSAGAHNISVSISEVNGAADVVASNNTKATNAFTGATKNVTRAALIEEFSSSTCVPCANLNVTFDPLVLANNANVASSNFNIIKYQMNWPNPGNDVSYNNDGSARRNFYGVNGIPDHFTNGAAGGAGDQAEITAAKVPSAFMDITGTYTVKKDSIIATATITPWFTITGGNYKVHMAATEYHYVNTGATTTQKDYYHVMRAMLNTGAGIPVTSWTSGVPQTFTWSVPYTVGTVTQMSNTFWSSPTGGNLVIFVQDASSQEVLQSKAVKPVGVGVNTIVNVLKDASIFPNPAVNNATLDMDLISATNVSVEVSDITGRIMSRIAPSYMSVGEHMINVPLTNLANGLYNVIVRTDAGNISLRLSVVK
ncbi:MAG: choice-of-anchor J domain-containing protein [Chitinophagaceae bacterium]